MLTERPVVFVHGWNSNSRAWDKTIALLDRPPYNANIRFALTSFDYGNDSASWPSEPDISYCLAEALVTLSRAYTNGGGDGKVLVVGHSMGGLAMRFASALSVDGTRVADILGGVITLGTPNTGSPWGGTWPAAAFQKWGETWSKVSLPPAGSSAEVCLAEPARRPTTCAAPPYFPVGLPVTSIGTQIYVERDLFGFNFGPKAKYALFGDGIVPQDSSTGYVGSGPPTASGKSAPTPKADLTIRVETCTYSTSYLGAGLLGGVLGIIGDEVLDDQAADALLNGSGSIALAELTGYAFRTPCFHTNLTHYGPVVDDLYSALTTDAAKLASYPATERGVAAAAVRALVTGDRAGLARFESHVGPGATLVKAAAQWFKNTNVQASYLFCRGIYCAFEGATPATGFIMVQTGVGWQIKGVFEPYGYSEFKVFDCPARTIGRTVWLRGAPHESSSTLWPVPANTSVGEARLSTSEPCGDIKVPGWTEVQYGSNQGFIPTDELVGQSS